jgi:hypothetical protein
MDMKTKWYSFTDSGIFEKQIMQECMSDKPDRIVLLGEMEMFIPEMSKKLVDFCKDQNIKLVIVHGCAKNPYHEDLYRQFGMDQTNVYYYPEHWITLTEDFLVRRIDYLKYQQQEYKHPYICLNNRAHYHRCVLIDELAKNNLIERGVVSWHNFLDENPNFEFKHFDKRILRLDDGFHKTLDSFLLPDQYHNSFIDLIGEATHLVPIMSEKSVIPLLLQKPFLVFSCKDWYKTYTNLGFELYTELFDYSFDSVDDVFVRASMVVQNLVNVMDRDYTNLYDKIRPKLEHNLNRVLQIKKTRAYIPDIIIEYVEHMKSSGLKKQGNNYRLWNIVDNATE